MGDPLYKIKYQQGYEKELVNFFNFVLVMKQLTKKLIDLCNIKTTDFPGGMSYYF